MLRLKHFMVVLALLPACRSSDKGSHAAATDEAEFSGSANWVLPIPPRLQWENGHGYCGETSIQSIGLYYGAWISQNLARESAGSEILLGNNSDDALTALHFTFENWRSPVGRDDFESYMVWIKRNLAKKIPIVIAAYVSDADDNPAYDHIMPATGVIAHNSNPAAYDGDDTLVYANLFDAKPLQRSFKSLGADRDCNKDTTAGGCIPLERDFGIAISGIADQDHASLPVRITVKDWDEPNVSATAKTPQAPRDMQATVYVSNLVEGQKYALLRYNDIGSVPTEGEAEDFLKSLPSNAIRTDFVATDATYNTVDKVPFKSNSAVYYRCVPVK